MFQEMRLFSDDGMGTILNEIRCKVLNCISNISLHVCLVKLRQHRYLSNLIRPIVIKRVTSPGFL